MPAEKQRAFGTPDVMKAEDGNDSLEPVLRKAIGRDPFLPIPRATDNPVQWLNLIQALDPQQGIN